MGKRSVRWAGILLWAAFAGISCEEGGSEGEYSSVEGVYSCQEVSPHSGVRQYPVEIEKVRDEENRYIILNFHNKGENEFLFIQRSRDTLWIAQQAIGDIAVNGWAVEGDGFRTLSLYYETDDGITILDYFATYSR